MQSHYVAQTGLELSIKPGGENREGGRKEGGGWEENKENKDLKLGGSEMSVGLGVVDEGACLWSEFITWNSQI